jgi:hypothetical protein
MQVGPWRFGCMHLHQSILTVSAAAFSGVAEGVFLALEK